jgi:hypothetical protein
VNGATSATVSLEPDGADAAAAVPPVELELALELELELELEPQPATARAMSPASATGQVSRHLFVSLDIFSSSSSRDPPAHD